MAGNPGLPGLARLRFDNSLATFPGLLDLYTGYSGRIESSNKKVIATNPLTPAELVYAAGALAYDPYTRESLIQSVMKENYELTNSAIDAGLSPDFNSWNLIMIGSVYENPAGLPAHAYSIACPNWDDQIKKSWQIMTEFADKPVYFWEIPRYDPEARKWALNFLRKEIEQFLSWLSAITGHKVSQNGLVESVRKANLIREDLAAIDKLVAGPGKVLPGLEYYLCQLLASDYCQDPDGLHAAYRSLIAELEKRAGSPGSGGDGMLRLYLMGDDTQQLQLFNGIEDYGGVLVGSDTRLSSYYAPVPLEGNMVENLAEWLWNMPANMPTETRVKATIPYIRAQKADAVIINSLTGSRNLPGSEKMVRDLIKEELGIPVLGIETSLPRQDVEKVDYLIKAFIEMSAY